MTAAGRLQDKIVLITGAGSGLGRQCSLLFTAEGASVVGLEIDEERLKDTAGLVGEQGGVFVPIAGDVTNEAQVAAAVDAAVAQFGRLDVMFANAGVIVPGNGAVPIDELTEDAWQEVLGTNLTGVFLCCKHAARVMKPAGSGTILATSSAAGLVAYPGMAAYSATKGGVNLLVKGLAIELGRFGIRVNALCPTHGMSPNFLLPRGAPVVGKSYEEMNQWNPAVSPIPLKLGRPPNIGDNAKVALFLACDDSAYMSGVCLPATDGGTLSQVAIFFPDNWLDLATDAVS
jgi:NAD(P)-dependent dehydrogenase (short-subunit alcohol dehydrogenase family)